MSFKKEHRQETIIYLASWTLLFMTPVMSLYIRTANTDASFDWSEIFTVWKQYGVFFLVFLIHNHLLAPMLIYQQQRKKYFALAATIVVIFMIWQYNHRPHFERRRPLQEWRSDDHRPPFDEGQQPPFDEGQRPPSDEGQQPPSETDDHRPPFDDADHRPVPPHERRHPGDHRPQLIMGQHDVVALIILILMLGMNLGVKLYFKQHRDEHRLADLERENLEQQLEYLKYQINPHFFMNTLNNIHALVDIDPEKAKTTILELSKMMRFVLYEGNKQGVPLDREIAFLQNYITLMKLRYTDKVKISVSTPASLPGKEIPPLMFITFVENAFKHGVSYRQDSFIDIQLSVEDERLAFTCRNSRIPKDEDKHGGVGLANVKKRLELIYGNRYTLDINDTPETYTVKLTIPIND